MNDKEKLIKVWITKYALSKGIFTAEAEVCTEGPSPCGMITVPGSQSLMDCRYHGQGRDWHTSEASAKAKAEKMRSKKIASMKKQIKKLEGIRF